MEIVKKVTDDCTTWKLPPGYLLTEVEPVKGENGDLLDSCKFKVKKERPLREAAVAGLVLALVLVSLQFGLYKFGFVGREFLSFNVQIGTSTSGLTAPDKIADDSGNGSER